MSNIYDSIKLGGPDSNAEYLGIFVAWLISNNLLSDNIRGPASRECASVLMQDMTGQAFLTTVLHGELKPDHLTEAGRGFSEDYFMSGKYREDYNASNLFGDDDWMDYDAVSPRITAAYRKYTQPEKGKFMAKILKFPSPRR